MSAELDEGRSLATKFLSKRAPMEVVFIIYNIILAAQFETVLFNISPYTGAYYFLKEFRCTTQIIVDDCLIIFQYCNRHILSEDLLQSDSIIAAEVFNNISGCGFAVQGTLRKLYCEDNVLSSQSPTIFIFILFLKK